LRRPSPGRSSLISSADSRAIRISFRMCLHVESRSVVPGHRARGEIGHGPAPAAHPKCWHALAPDSAPHAWNRPGPRPSDHSHRDRDLVRHLAIAGRRPPGPSSAIFLPMRSKRGLARAKAGLRSPVMMTSRASLPPTSPPETGASRAERPRSRATVAIRRASTGLEVVMSIRSAPASPFRRSAPAPR